MKIHSTTKFYKCTICGATYSRIDNLYLHRRSHPGAEPYQCKCGAEFSRLADLREHTRIHHEPKVPLSPQRLCPESQV